MIYFGNDKIKEIYHGSDKIKEVWYGNDLVWSGKKPSYAILTDGTRIDFELENTPMHNLETTTTSMVLNRTSYKKDTIKEITFGNSYGNVTSIGIYFLRSCSNLTSVDLSAFSNVTSIGNYVLHFCQNLTSVDLSAFSNVTSIGDNFLYYCRSLTSVDLSAFSNVTSIGKNFLQYCSKLTQFKIGAINVPQTGTTGFLQTTPALTTILVPCESVQAYKTTSPWSNFANIISCPATKAPTILFKANEVNVGFKYFRGDGGYNITNEGIELSISNWTFSVVGTNLAYDVSKYSGIRVKYIQENSTNIETKVVIGLTNSPTTSENRMYSHFINGSPGTYEREAIFEFTTVDGVVDKYGASIFIQYQEGFTNEKPNAKITITEIEMI